MTNTITTKSAVLTNAILINGMKENGVEARTTSNGALIYTHCPRCAERVISLDAAFTKDNIKDLPWYQSKSAIIFKNGNGNTLKACRCGYRELVVITPKSRCAKCGAVIKSEGARCYGPNCQPPTQQELDAITVQKNQAVDAKAAELEAKSNAEKEVAQEAAQEANAAEQEATYIAEQKARQVVKEAPVKQEVKEAPVKQCVTPGCVNPVPEAKFVRCEACRAARRAPKEAASSSVQM